METMKAARWHGVKDIRVEEVTVPSPGRGQVKVAVQYAGICGSDLHEYTHGPQLIPFNEPYPLSGHHGVTTMGHEFSGIVEEAGAGVENIKKGDRVVIEPIYKNFDSPFITTGEYNLGEHLGFIGLAGDGGFAKYVVVEDYMVHRMPDSMSFEQGALVEPAAVAVYAALKGGITLGHSVLISGAGPIGLLCVQAARAAGAVNIIVSDVAEKRLEKAKEIGATHILDAREKDLPEKIKKLSGGLGVNIFLDCAGVEASFQTGLASLRNGGTAVLVALFGKPVKHNALDQVLREITIKAIIAYRNVFPQTIALIDSGQMQVEKLVTSKITLDEIVPKGFEALVNSPSEVKVLVDVKK